MLSFLSTRLKGNIKGWPIEVESRLGSIAVSLDIKQQLRSQDWRTWPVQSESIRWGMPEALLAFLGAQSLQILWFTGAASLLWGGDIPDTESRAPWTTWFLSFGLWAGYFLGPIFMNRVTGSGKMIDFNLRVPAKWLVIAAAIGAAIQLVVLPVLYFPLLRLVDADPGQTARELAATVDTPLEILIFFGSAVIVAPFVEEWFYRGMLLPALARRFNPAVGILGSSALFALVHIRPILFPGIFTLAVVLAVMTMKTKRLAPAIVTHMAFNAVTATSLVYF